MTYNRRSSVVSVSSVCFFIFDTLLFCTPSSPGRNRSRVCEVARSRVCEVVRSRVCEVVRSRVCEIVRSRMCDIQRCRAPGVGTKKVPPPVGGSTLWSMRCSGCQFLNTSPLPDGSASTVMGLLRSTACDSSFFDRSFSM